ncbi:MAG: hypothetical protein MPW14_11065 [Candidatus Manganitrophus sp.]|nr:MAG: hypothetical protein MPW14_11065 [Candidatus Manganitrophus sp.]
MNAIFAGDHLNPLAFHLGDDSFQDLQALVQRLREALLFQEHRLRDQLSMLLQIGIGAAHRVDHQHRSARGGTDPGSRAVFRIERRGA